MSASLAPPGLQGPEKDIVCPACRQPCKYGPSNPWRPFCSARCKTIDLGRWLKESYRLPAEEEDNAVQSEETGIP